MLHLAHANNLKFFFFIKWGYASSYAEQDFRKEGFGLYNLARICMSNFY